MRLIRYLAFKIVVSVAENMGPSAGAGGTAKGKRRADEIGGRVDDIGAAEWTSRGLGTERGKEEFVVVGKRGVQNLNVILSLLQLVSHPHFRKCGILVFLI